MKFGPYPATVIRVHDGDTCVLDIDLGFGVRMGLSCRAYGINSPELSTDAGKAARDYAKQLLPVGLAVKVDSYGWDKFGGRFDGILTLPDGRNWSDCMIDAGHAVKLS